MSRPSIILTGFMGTGKTSVGRVVAARTGRAFVDTDDLIEKRAGVPIADIFAEYGQPVFRQWESDVARWLAGTPDLVIATGGRLMLDPANAAALEAGNVVFCLTAEPHEILTRLENEPRRRPLLEGSDRIGRIEQLLARRADAYGRYSQVSTSGKTVEDVAEAIMGLAGESMAGSRGQVASGRWQVTLDVPTQRLPVAYPGGQYDVIAGYDLLPWLKELAAPFGPAAIVTDSSVGPLYVHRCGRLLDEGAVITIPAGEASKNLESVRAIYDRLLAAGLDRRGTVMALGGGVVGDVAGFVAATYLRGVRFVQCPTTLLAMVDASVGGKTGVDLPQGKNLVGAFKQPAVVIADLDTLQTLPPDEFAGGMAEVLKSGLIGSPELIGRLEIGDWRFTGGAWNQSLISNLQSLILEAVRVKRGIVQADPFESGRRAVLNLGHTFAHAIEHASQYEVGHGRAVAMGLAAAAHLSAALGHCSATLPERIEVMLQNLDLPTYLPAGMSSETVLAAMRHDKKQAAGRLRFVLLRDVGDVFVSDDVPEAAVLATLATLQL